MTSFRRIASPRVVVGDSKSPSAFGATTARTSRKDSPLPSPLWCGSTQRGRQQHRSCATRPADRHGQYCQTPQRGTGHRPESHDNWLHALDRRKVATCCPVRHRYSDLNQYRDELFGSGPGPRPPMSATDPAAARRRPRASETARPWPSLPASRRNRASGTLGRAELNYHLGLLSAGQGRPGETRPTSVSKICSTRVCTFAARTLHPSCSSRSPAVRSM